MFKKVLKLNIVETFILLFILVMLVVICIPIYENGKTQSRKNEAKVGLIELYTAERAYAVQHSTFTACLRDLGFKNDSAPRYYALGFSNSAASKALCGPEGNVPCNLCSSSGLPSNSDAKNQINATQQVAKSQGSLERVNSEISSQTPDQTSISRSAFSAIAVGNISNDSGIDRWKINERRELVNF